MELVWIGVFKCNEGAECEFNMDGGVYVVTICRLMLHRAAKVRLNFWPLIFALYDRGSLVDLALVSLLSHVFSYSICCMSESMLSAYTKKKKKIIFHMTPCIYFGATRLSRYVNSKFCKLVLSINL